MSQSDKSRYFQALKAAGVSFDKHYREYNTETLKAAYVKLTGSELPPEQPVQPEPAPVAPPEPEPETFEPLSPPLDHQPVGGFDPDERPVDPEAAAFFGFELPTTPRAPKDINEMAGMRQNTNQADDEPIRVDPDTGRAWFQEEILKPAFPKPRGRRVLQYMDSGVQQKTVTNGQYYESFEIAGDAANARPAEVKVTLPSYQVGIYRDPRFPFKVHCYNGAEGFDLFEVQDFYHGPELVPQEIKRIYVENVLCYDIRTTVRAIEDEYRHLQMTGKVQ